MRCGVRNERNTAWRRGAELCEGFAPMKWEALTKHHSREVCCRLRRPEGWQCVEGVAERSLGRQIFTRNTLPHRRPPEHFLTNGKQIC
jgi:hypothetical protein